MSNLAGKSYFMVFKCGVCGNPQFVKEVPAYRWEKEPREFETFVTCQLCSSPKFVFDKAFKEKGSSYFEYLRKQ